MNEMGAIKMELRHLEYFHAVAELASFTRAAEQLHVSQPAITTAVKHPEEELGVTLFVRDKRRVMLTYEGRLFLEKTLPPIQNLKLAMQDIQKMSSDYDRILNIGLTPVAGAQLAANLYGGFSALHPDIHFQLLEMGTFGVMDAIDRDEIDIGYLVILEQARTRYGTCGVEKGLIRAVMHRDHPLAVQQTVSVGQLAGEPIISLPSHSFLWKNVDEAYAARGLKPRVICAPQQMFTVFNLIQQNVGISFTLGDNFTSVMRTENLVSIPLEPPIPFVVGFVWKKEKKLNRAARQCIAYVRENMEKRATSAL